MRFEVSIHHASAYPTITLKDTLSGSSAEIFAFGGLLNAFSVPINTVSFNVIDGFDSVEDAVNNITNGFKSARLSPFVCRMNNGSYTFDNTDFRIDKFYLADHAIHGITYDCIYEVKDLLADEEHASVMLHTQYKGEDKGYPFSFEVSLKWKLESDNKITVRAAVHHNNPHPVPYAEGWHPYFKLGTKVDDCKLQFDSSVMLEFDESLLPTGRSIKDERFRKPASLKGLFLDNCFELDKAGHPTCILQNENLELTIEPEPSYPYLQVYTPDHRNSIAIENLSSAPDAFNNGIGLQLLLPNHIYNYSTSYQLKVK